MSQILMGLVIAMFVITAAYVGMHAAEEKEEYKKDYGADGHNIEQDISSFNEDASVMMLSIISRTIV